MRNSHSEKQQDNNNTTTRRLVLAAKSEFCEVGYFGTDSNKIARRAGFAPQTFYRWYDDKLDVFLAVYSGFLDELLATSGRLISSRASDDALISATVRLHRRYAIFRRSLRHLALEDERVRRARTQSRIRQIAQIQVWLHNSDVTAADVALFILEHERLCDAVADGELRDLGLGPQVAHRRLRELYRELRQLKRRPVTPPS